MTIPFTGQYEGWKRDREELGLWRPRRKVAIVGWGQSPVDRRWDGVSMDKTLGACAMTACTQALEDAGVRPGEVDGLLCYAGTGAGATGGSSADWAPRPYFAAPYDSEWGLSRVNAKWLIDNMTGLTNIKFAPENAPMIGEEMGMAAQAVADGLCNICLVAYPMNNFEGRYRRGGDYASDYAQGARQWDNPWGHAWMEDGVPLRMYCTKYGVTWEELMAPVILNQHRNGLMNSWGFYSRHGASGLTYEDYVNSKPIYWPLRIWDCDRPVHGCSAYLITTAERARDMRQKPIYILNHNGGDTGRVRSSQKTGDEQEEANARAARMSYEGSGFRPKDVDIFNPYDGFSWFLPFFLEAYGWHGVQKGEARDFFNGDIRVEGSHPFCSGGGNLGNGRTRSAMYIDTIQQLRGTAGKRQVKVKAETAICGYSPFTNSSLLCVTSALP